MCASSMQNQRVKSKFGQLNFKTRVQGDLLERTVFPLQKIFVGRAGLEGREFLEAQFGLVPAWVKDEKGGPKYGRHCYNARTETIFEKPSFKKAILERRAVIPVAAFFEYADLGNNGRLRVSRQDEEPILLAAIWEHHPVYGLTSCSILTTEPLAILQGVHSRSPLILEEGDLEPWLDPTLKTPAAIKSF